MTDFALYLVVGALGLGCVGMACRMDKRKRRRTDWKLSDNWQPPQKEQERQ